MPASLTSRRLDVPDSFAAVQAYYEERGWTDGLPVVPATEDLVWEMLGTFGHDPGHSLGTIQPRNAPVTLEKLAVNAVMAGCRPEHFPVVVAAVRAILQPEFNVAGCQATTGGAAPVLIINGPLATQLQINGDAGCFGPGYRANAVLGRAVRLIIRNIGGLIPGEMDKATLSTPGRYSFCFAENEARSPWEPRHVGLGFPASASTVTISAVRAVYPVMETTVANGAEILHTLVEAIKTVGCSNYYQIGTGAQMTLILCPEHAVEMAAAGLTKPAIRDYVFQQARLPMHRLQGLAHYGNRNWPAWVDERDPDFLVPVVPQADDLVVVVAGGDGRHSAWLAGWGVTRVVTQEITTTL